MRHFDFQKMAREAGIPAPGLAELCRLVRREFPRDEMMYELHLVRACMAIRDGHVSLENALRGEPAAKEM